jgi:hypothetical protein
MSFPKLEKSCCLGVFRMLRYTAFSVGILIALHKILRASVGGMVQQEQPSWLSRSSDRTFLAFANARAVGCIRRRTWENR